MWLSADGSFSRCAVKNVLCVVFLVDHTVVSVSSLSVDSEEVEAQPLDVVVRRRQLESLCRANCVVRGFPG